MRRFLYTLMALLVMGLLPALGQGGLHIEQPVWDFGSIAEDQGEIKHSFRVENRGKSPLVILDVVASCGCTKPAFSRRPLLSGQGEDIEVTFRPAGMSGMVERVLTIYGDRQQVIGRLTLRGTVNPRERTLEEIYLIDLGHGVRLTQNFLSLGELRHEEMRELRLGVVNSSSEVRTLRFEPLQGEAYPHLEAPSTLQPGQRAEVVLRVKVSASTLLYGLWQPRWRIRIDGEASRVPLMLHALVVDASPRGGGVARLEEMNIRLGELRHDHGPHRGEIVIHNEGREPLYLRAVALDRELTTSLHGGEVIPAGGVLRASVWLDSSEMDYGGFSRNLHLVFSGEEPVRRLRVSGFLVE